MCARKIGAQRAGELRQVVKAVADRGGSAALLTFTVRHHRRHSLKAVWNAVTGGWTNVTGGKQHAADVALFGVRGWCKATEVTYGEHGWHVHLHVLMIFDDPVSDDLLAELSGRMWARWERSVGRKGFTASAENGGLDCRPVAMTADSPDRVADYFTKVAYEVTGQSTKDGRFGNRSPMQVLADGVATGNADDLERWWDFEQGSRGRRQMTWSRGLREWAGVGRRKTDEEVANTDEGGESVLVVDPDGWPQIREDVAVLLTVAERDGIAGAQAWLTARGCHWWAPPRERLRDELPEHWARP